MQMADKFQPVSGKKIVNGTKITLAIESAYRSIIITADPGGQPPRFLPKGKELRNYVVAEAVFEPFAEICRPDNGVQVTCLFKIILIKTPM